MNLYVWPLVGEITDNYHDGGGVVVIAESLEDARLHLLQNKKSKKDDRNIKTTSNVFVDDPCYVINLSEATEQSWVFSDAGCC